MNDALNPVTAADADAKYRTDHIRSFSGRRGHITPGQRLAYDTLADRYCIDYHPSAHDFSADFDQPAPLVLEIGFGMGESTATIAAARPDCNFIGVEVYPAGVGSLLRRIEMASLNNVRIIQHDAWEVVRDMLTANSLAGIHIFFPDPWHKARHHKRRLVQSPFVAMLAARLKPGGYVHCATDWQPYAEQMLAVLSAEPLLANSAVDYAQRPDYRPLTKFENRGLRLGHVVRDLVFRCPDTPEPQPGR